MRTRRSLHTARQHIHAALYNPTTGYFQHRARIISQPAPVHFRDYKNTNDFLNQIARLYSHTERPILNGPEAPVQKEVEEEEHVQVWHTPVEIYRPHYGIAIAKCIIQKYQTSPASQDPLMIVEIGAGNGTLMTNILDYIKQNHPKIYETVSYTIIEISVALNKIQKIKGRDHLSRLKFENVSIFRWKTKVKEKAFIIALEVIDNFAHDIIRYDLRSGTPLQTYISRNSDDGGFSESFDDKLDPLLKEYLQLGIFKPPKLGLQRFFGRLPYMANLSTPYHIPTDLLMFLKILREYFPNSSLFLSDFYHLPDASQGHRAPVVQTRFQGQSIACSTYLVQQGHFDIFYPTDFEELGSMYSKVIGGSVDNLWSHAEFIARYSDLEICKTRSGEIPMMDMYQNVKVIFAKPPSWT